MANPSSNGRPSWQKNPLFEFFASLKLAVVLLIVLIVAAIAGTIYESSFDAKVARAYIYGAPWFNFWLVLLGANLTVSALSRWPWKKHHTAFLITHLGIITLLVGSLIGRTFGIEGSITLFKGDPPTNRLLVDRHQLRIHDIDGIVKGYSAEFLHRPPTPQHPRELGVLASGAKLSIVDYASELEGKLNPRPVKEGGAPAIHFTVNTAMMNQHLERWLLADDPQNQNFSMGLANIELKRGRAGVVAEPSPQTTVAAGVSPAKPGEQPTRLPLPAQETDLDESIFAFSNTPNDQIAHAGKGGSTGAKVRLLPPENSNKCRVLVSLGQSEAAFDVADHLGREADIPGSHFKIKIDNYWPDFRIQDGKPNSVSDQPNNPAVLVTISGKGVPVAEPAEKKPHGGDPAAAGPTKSTTGGPPTMPAPGEQTPNHLTLFVADDGVITYELVSRKNGRSTGKLDLNRPLTTGWADWQLIVDLYLPHADSWTDFFPAKSSVDTNSPNEFPEGIRVRFEQAGEKLEPWVPSGWQISVPTSPQPTLVSYGFTTIPLPIGLELLDFEVKRNEGSDSPAGFKSTLRISTAEGETATGSCWMNHPFSFPAGALHTWTGLTYKISQASWNPDNLAQSTVQILRDPGWLLKWIGSLLIVAGVFMMFYLKPYRKQTIGEQILPSKPQPETESVDTKIAELSRW